MNQITIVKVVSSNFIFDFFAKFQNLIGKNLTKYEKMVNKGIQQIQQELKDKNITLKWFRYEITQLTNGAMVIMLYGEGM